jgi:hypothetical protein
MQMLSKREYFIPLISAQYQFPNHYYGLTSAALLEDLFVDASINFKNQEHYSLQLERPERTTEENEKTDAKGEKGWDYKFEGQNYSHKVGAKVQDIALLWDATYQLPEDGTYSYPSPIVMVLSNYKDKNGSLILNSGERFQVSSIGHYRSKLIKCDQQILFVSREDKDVWKILEIINLQKDGTLSEVFGLSQVWTIMMSFWSNGFGANTIEIFVTKSSNKRIAETTVSEAVKIEFKALPGIYLFPKESLQKVKAKKNNRAILLPKEKVEELMNSAVANRHFTYLPNWFTSYATNRSVDLYLVQRAEYDRLNSAARN